MSDEMAPAKNVVEALARVMAELPAIGKDGQAAPQQGGYRYRGIDQITAAAQALFAKHGIVFLPQCSELDIREIEVQGKPWTDTMLTVTYEVCHGPSDTSKMIRVPGIGRDNSDKGANKAMTQAFKYALLQALCISDARDDGDAVTHEAEAIRTAQREPKPTSATPDTISDAQLKFLNNLLHRTGRDLTMLTDVIGREVASPPYLTKPEASKVINHLNTLPDLNPAAEPAPQVNQQPKGLPNNILRQVSQAMRDAKVEGPQFVPTAIKVIERDITGLEEMTPSEATKVVAAMQELASF